MWDFLVCTTCAMEAWRTTIQAMLVYKGRRKNDTSPVPYFFPIFN